MTSTEASTSSTATTTSQTQNGMRVISAPYIENLEEFIRQKGGIVEAMRDLQKTYNELKYLQNQMVARRDNFRLKLPDIESTLSALYQLQKPREQPQKVNYELAEGVYATATVDKSLKTVNLWLGANVMLEYSFDEAIKLLEANLDGAKKSIARFAEDLAMIKDRLTTLEVNMARLYNLDVKLRKQQSH